MCVEESNIEEVERSAKVQAYWEQLSCRFPAADRVFDECIKEAKALLSEKGVTVYIDNAHFLGKMGRGAEPLLVYLEETPSIAKIVGEDILPEIKDFCLFLSTNTNFKAIIPFLQSLAAVTRRLHSYEELHHYFDLIKKMMNDTTGSVHGHHKTFPSPGLPLLLEQAPRLLSQVSLEGFRNWIEYGVRYYKDHPERQKDYFSLQSPDAVAVMQRERHGTLLVDHERQLDLYLRGLWQDGDYLVPYSLAFDELRKPMPYFDHMGIRLPDVYDDLNGVSGINRYRAALAHIAAHRRWSSKMVVDNWSPFQRIAVALFEDCRVEYLAMQKFPGLRKLFLSLHPIPNEEALQRKNTSLINLRLALASRVILDPNFEVENKDINEFVARFFAVMEKGASSSSDMADIALSFIARTRRQTDASPNTYFENTEVDYRDDNRHLWIYIEQGDDEDTLFEHLEEQKQSEDVDALPPRHYHEWDYNSQTYRPDWVSVYEAVHPSGNVQVIENILEKHSVLAKRLKAILDALKPQQRVRIRYQEEGSELDLDVAIRSLIDLKSGSQPDMRINMSHKNDGRDIAVMLVVDLSQSLNEKAAGSMQTILELSQEAVSLLAWTIDKLGDKFAIGGFNSDTRHNVRYAHIKGFAECFDSSVKGRLAAMEAKYSTRMGAAMRHAAHYLEAQKADKKLMLVLTDGEPADIDVDDEQLLIQDTRQAVVELQQQGIYSYCINLDPKADEYVADIFGNHYTVIDHVDKLPEQLPKIFMSLTK
ncbi:MAG: VWA domain-containing protein [Mariprofundaceae bacterium]|nr:VWA domain-containing protein [Mariprofundaceae bacterium]